MLGMAAGGMAPPGGGGRWPAAALRSHGAVMRAAAPMACDAAAVGSAIGFQTGGAGDAANFRENVAAGRSLFLQSVLGPSATLPPPNTSPNRPLLQPASQPASRALTLSQKPSAASPSPLPAGKLPLQSDVTFEGMCKDYFFETLSRRDPCATSLLAEPSSCRLRAAAHAHASPSSSPSSFNLQRRRAPHRALCPRVLPGRLPRPAAGGGRLLCWRRWLCSRRRRRWACPRSRCLPGGWLGQRPARVPAAPPQSGHIARRVGLHER